MITKFGIYIFFILVFMKFYLSACLFLKNLKNIVSYYIIYIFFYHIIYIELRITTIAFKLFS